MNPLQEERERATSLDDVRIRRVRPLISPALLQDELPADASVERAVAEDRKAIARIVQGDDRRLLAIVG
ncbi:MAG TPA: 3-deoxy-7-phosphoheptulonate synthase, partial [Ramlibacter sp.]